jgi:tetratricopeptide (TPR) repeat protein
MAMELSAAQQFQGEALRYAEAQSALLSEARALVQDGRAAEALELFPRARRDLQAFQDKWDAVIQGGDDPSFAEWWRQYVAGQRVSILTNEGLALRWMGRLGEACALFESGLEMSPVGSDDHASMLDALGGIRYDQQAYAEAEELFRRAHAEYVALAGGVTSDDPDSAGRYWNYAAQELLNCAHAAISNGDFAGCEKTFDEAIGFAERHELPDLANSLWLRQARYLLAADASGETIQRVKSERARRCSRSKDPGFKYEALLLTAAFWGERGEFDQAREELEEARAYATPQQQWFLLSRLSDTAESQGDVHAARDYSQAALTMARQFGVSQQVTASLRALVSLHAEDDPVEAERYLSELRDTGDLDEIKSALTARATVYCMQKRFEPALRDLDEAERAAPGDPNVLSGRVVVLRGMGAKEEALGAVEKAVAAFREQIRRSGTDLKTGLDMLGALHETAAFLAAELGRAVEAFTWAEHGKALRLRSRLVEPADAPKTAEVDYPSLRERLRAESAALIFFSVTRRGTLALLCDPRLDEPRPFFLDLTEEALAAMLPAGLQDMPWNTAVFDALGPLSEKLAPCLSEAVGREQNGKLYVVPDSQLYFVPFAALDLGGSQVIDHCAVTYLPCAANLVSRPPGGGGSRTCLAVGEGVVEGFSFAEQAAQVAALNWDASECLEGATARDFLDRAARFKVLHLQCHGQMEGSLPGTRSASILELAGRSRLSAKDVYGLPLEAELVFLNACVSGRFQSRLAGEVGGFWEAFLHAGAREVIATLAYVHPDSAQRLALAFYGHWLEGKGSAEALRQAQLEVRRERPEPYDWATHILIG